LDCTHNKDLADYYSVCQKLGGKKPQITFEVGKWEQQKPPEGRDFEDEFGGTWKLEGYCADKIEDNLFCSDCLYCEGAEGTGISNQGSPMLLRNVEDGKHCVVQPQVDSGINTPGTGNKMQSIKFIPCKKQ